MDESDRTSGFDGTSTSLSFFFLFSVRTFVARTYRPQFLRYRDEIVQADCPIGGNIALKKILGVGPPWGKFFPKIVFRDIDLTICVSNAHDPGKIWLIFLRLEPKGLS